MRATLPSGATDIFSSRLPILRPREPCALSGPKKPAQKRVVQSVRMNAPASKEESMPNLRVNGQERAYDGDPSMPLLWYLRDELSLTGTKFGCGAALCGACTVHIDGNAARSCVTPMASVAGKSVTTIEGLDANGEHPLQIAWREVGVPQCGYCQTGQIMQAASLLAKK